MSNMKIGHMKNKNYLPPAVMAARSQRGAAPIVGIVIICALVLVAVVVAFLALANSKQSATLQQAPVEVKADDLLTTGKSNGELLIDQKIIKAGLDRDETQRKEAEKAMTDQANPVGEDVTTDTTVESARLSSLQTDYIDEVDRRLDLLDKTTKLTSGLEPSQKPNINKIINDEVTALTGLKAKAAAATSKESFIADRDALAAEYKNFIVAIVQTRLVVWANKQTALDEKVNVLGGKFQERINDASSSGNSTATAQTSLNSYQANKTQAKTQTAEALKAALAVKIGSYEANRAVMKTYFDKLSSSHGQVENALSTATTITQEIAAYK